MQRFYIFDGTRDVRTQTEAEFKEAFSLDDVGTQTEAEFKEAVSLCDKDSDFLPDVAEEQSAKFMESSGLFNKFGKVTITTAVCESKGGNFADTFESMGEPAPG